MADVITVAEAKAQLNITGDVDDAELADYVAAATAVVEDHVGPVTPREFSEVQQANGPVLVCHHAPVLSVTSLTPVLTGGTGHAVVDLHVDGATGIIRRLDGGRFVGLLQLTYQAGRAELPANIGLAARIIVGHLWETQRGHGARPGFGDEDVTATPTGFAVPHRAMQLLAPDRLAPVVT